MSCIKVGVFVLSIGFIVPMHGMIRDSGYERKADQRLVAMAKERRVSDYNTSIASLKTFANKRLPLALMEAGIRNPEYYEKAFMHLGINNCDTKGLLLGAAADDIHDLVALLLKHTIDTEAYDLAVLRAIDKGHENTIKSFLADNPNLATKKVSYEHVMRGEVITTPIKYAECVGQITIISLLESRKSMQEN